MLTLAIALIVSFAVTLLIVRYAHTHARFLQDSDIRGVQKFHARPVPRIGGVGILLGLAAGAAGLQPAYPDISRDILLLAACGLPAFLAGFAEDLTKRVSPLMRLLCTMLAAIIAYRVLGIHIARIDIRLLDPALTFAAVSTLLTVLCVAGMANAMNIIDGFNGLASMVAIIMFASLGYVGFQVKDPVVLSASMIMAGAIIGFFILNFPGGLIFLGDGGAYFIGFMLAEVAILLVMRNPQVSAWYPALMVIYPIFETCFSIYRKRFVRGMSPGIPDGVHLHMLVYKRLMRWAVGAKTASALTRRNSLTSPYLWLLCLLAVVPATIFWRHTIILIVCCALFVLTYVWLYLRIVRFRAPRWLVFKKRR